MDDLTDRTADLLGLCDVQRWTVIRTGRGQTVAEHVFAVIVIASELAARLGVRDIHLQLVMAWALVHDVPEVLTGDIDGKFKRDYLEARTAICEAEVEAFPWYKAAADATPPHIRAIVKVADQIEAINFIHTWGVGARADDVYRELQRILDWETIPRLEEEMAGIAMAVPVNVRAVCKHVMDHSVGDENCIQLRRHRGAGR